MTSVRVAISGHHLPGRATCGSEASPLRNVHVGIQVGRDPHDLVPGDAPRAGWEVDIEVIERDGGLDFRGPAVQGRRGDRFLYLTWGDVDGRGEFAMFRRAKLMLDRIDSAVLASALAAGHLACSVDLTGPDGGPRCARVDPPAVEWFAGDPPG